MIVRIMGHGQVELADSVAHDLTEVDHALLNAVEADDADRFTAALKRLHEIIDRHGRRLPADYLGASEMIVPEPGTTLDEAHEMLRHVDLPPAATQGQSR